LDTFDVEGNRSSFAARKIAIFSLEEGSEHANVLLLERLRSQQSGIRRRLQLFLKLDR
jgi:hypothetical protein